MRIQMEVPMFSRLLLLSCVLTPLCWSQTRMIPHVTSSTGGFSTQILLTNQGAAELSWNLVGYSVSGELVKRVSGTLNAEQTSRVEATELFEAEISHFTIEADENLQVTVAYQAQKDGITGPAHVGETSQQAYRWRLFPGNRVVTWDGIAVVNSGDAATAVTIAQYGSVSGASHIPEALASLPANGKGLHVLSDLLNGEPNTWYEISADQRLGHPAAVGTAHERKAADS